MAINVEFRDERGSAILVLDGVYLTPAHLPDYDDLRYPYLRLIDPYGDTVFSAYQMTAVVPELEAWAAERPSAEIQAVSAVARRCADEVHTYLVFVGD